MLIFFLILLVSLIIIPILAVMIINNVTFFDAIDVICKKFEDWNTKAIEETPFDVLIGFNGFGFNFYEIEQKFEELHRYWDLYALLQVDNINPNYTVYVFKVFNIKNEHISKNNLLYRVQNLAENALILHFREHNIVNSAEGFIAVDIRGNVLKIAIAKNCKGLSDIQRFQRHLH